MKIMFNSLSIKNTSGLKEIIKHYIQTCKIEIKNLTAGRFDATLHLSLTVEEHNSDYRFVCQ